MSVLTMMNDTTNSNGSGGQAHTGRQPMTLVIVLTMTNVLLWTMLRFALLLRRQIRMMNSEATLQLHRRSRTQNLRFKTVHEQERYRIQGIRFCNTNHSSNLDRLSITIPCCLAAGHSLVLKFSLRICPASDRPRGHGQPASAGTKCGGQR